MIALALTLVAAPAVVATPVDKALKAAHKDYQAQLLDKFAATSVDAKLAGLPFKVMVPLGNGDALSVGSRSSAYYTFAKGKLRLILSPGEMQSEPGLDAKRYLIAKIGGETRSTRSYTGSNSFGVSARVNVSSFAENGIALLERPEGQHSPYHVAIPGVEISTPKNNYWVELDLPGAQAKRVALDSQFVIEGVTANFENGTLTECDGFYAAPTITAAREVYGETCWIGARVRRIALVRKSSGEVLKEWLVK